MGKTVPRGTGIQHQQQHTVPRQQECYYFIGKKWQEKLREVNPSTEYTLLLPHGSSRERKRHNCILSDR
jgi:hypothetical protein